MKNFCVLRAKIDAYLMNDDSEKKKVKETKKFITRPKMMFENYTDCLFNEKTILKS